MAYLSTHVYTHKPTHTHTRTHKLKNPMKDMNTILCTNCTHKAFIIPMGDAHIHTPSGCTLILEPQ